MSTISLPKFLRVIDRAEGVRADPICDVNVRGLFDDFVAAPVANLRASIVSESAAALVEGNARVAAMRAIADLDVPYRVLRSVLNARFPALGLPGTLKDQPTATDCKVALQLLLGTVESYRAEPWAATVLSGPFGTLAPACIDKITAFMAARSVLATASADRANKMDTAYQAFLLFKDAVRQAHGIGSTLYRDLKLRVRTAPVVAPAPVPAPVVSPSPAVTTLAVLPASEPVAEASRTNGASH